MAAVGRRVCKLSSIPGFGASKSKVSSSSWSFHRSIFDPFPVSGARHFSQWVKFNGKHLFLVDTLALVRTLEGEGVPSKQADAIIAATTEVLKDSLENVSQSFVSKGEMRKIEMILESNLSKFKAEMQSSQVRRLEGEGVPSKQAEVIIATTTEVLNDSLENVSQSLVSKEEMQKIETMQESNLSKFKAEVESSQGHYFSRLHHETEKLSNDVEKMCIELRHDIDKVGRGLRSDFNLEMRKISEELSKQKAEISEELSKQKAETNILTNKLDGVSNNMTSKSDFNVEMGKIREELSKQKAETNILTNKLDGLTSKLDGVSENLTSKLKAETNILTNKLDGLTSKLDGVSENLTSKLNGEMASIRAHVEAGRYDNMKYFMGTIVSIATVGLAVLRLSYSK